VRQLRRRLRLPPDVYHGAMSTKQTTQPWDPAVYARNARYVSDLGAPVVELLAPKAGERILDLGCGDGRIVVTAAKLGARGIGIDIDPQRVKEANENVARNGVGDRVKILSQDLFTTDVSEATVVTLYLLPSLNLRLRPTLWKTLKPGTRVVSHDFDMGDWKPEQTLNVDGATIYYWTITPDLAKRAAAEKPQ